MDVVSVERENGGGNEVCQEGSAFLAYILSGQTEAAQSADRSYMTAVKR